MLIQVMNDMSSLYSKGEHVPSDMEEEHQGTEGANKECSERGQETLPARIQIKKTLKIKNQQILCMLTSELHETKVFFFKGHNGPIRKTM